VATLEELKARMTELISQPRFSPATWGIKAVSLDTGLTLYETNAGKLLKPASNAKLFTAALTLDRLGPDHRIKTSFYSTAKPNRSGTLDGDLILYGRGDPSFAARFNDGDPSKSLAPLVDALVAVGVKRIRGDLIGDESYFRGLPFGSSWTWDDLQYYYGAEVSALTQEDNVADLIFRPGAKVGAPCLIETRPATGLLTFINQSSTTESGGEQEIHLHRSPGENTVRVSGQLPLGATNWNDTVAVHDPARWFVTRLKEELDRRGVKISGRLRTVDWHERQVKPIDQSKLFELASVESRPLSEIIVNTLKPSQNLYAQLLLLQVGTVVEEKRLKAKGTSDESEDGTRTTEEQGIAELRKFLGEAGINKREVLFDEGSGLSRRALVTPNAIVQLLTFMSQHRHADTYRAALPVAGVDGTLRNRMRGTVAEKNVTAKTGTLGYVFTMSGYLNTIGSEEIAFSILLNNYDADSNTAREDVDAVAILLAEFRGRSRGGKAVTY
jgi:D-alanyl-D-alanine carboxypeptidase/D-alanyl-D-alanine-endopeptidase (penicillin-binding protein 4)